MTLPSLTRVIELVEHHWGPIKEGSVCIPPTCVLSDGVCADVLSILLARGFNPDQLPSLCERLFNMCTTNAELLARACIELYALSDVDAVSSTQIGARLGFQATDSRPALAFCLQSVCMAIDALVPRPTPMVLALI